MFNWKFSDPIFNEESKIIGCNWLCTGIKKGLTAGSHGEVKFNSPTENESEENLKRMASEILNFSSIESEIENSLNNFVPE